MKKKELFLQEKKISVPDYEDFDNKSIFTDKWLQQCLWNKSFPECCEKAEQYLKESANSEEFIDKFLADKSLSIYQAYAEISRKCRPETHWYKIREIFGERTFKTDADAGAVKVGNDNFSVLIPNGIGDGTVRVAVFNKDENDVIFNPNMMNYIGSVTGKDFYIYDYDCGNTPATTTDGKVVKLNGSYFVYNYEGLVALVQHRC